RRSGPDGPGQDFATGRLEAPRNPEAGRAGARPPRRPRDTLLRSAQRLGPADRLDKSNDWLLARPVRQTRRSSQEDGPMTATATATETRSVVIERETPPPPEKLGRALTQPHLIEEWLMKNDFKPVMGHQFNPRGDWGGVLDCEVLV